jgi:arsenite/tail-anchored protein-transporting ATPase
MRAAPATPDVGGAHRPRYHFVGGKGGVGKTTCAAAMAIRSASRGASTLIVSTDPAPSLGDAFGIRLGRRPRRVHTRKGQLHAVEVDAAAVMRDWLSTRSSMLREIALRGTWLDADDVRELLGLTLPGIDELAGLFEIVRFGRSRRYDRIVVDTAPTGHTLRMLAMPDTLGRVAEVFEAMQDKHRAIVAALRGRWAPDAADAFVRSLADDARELSALVRDRDRTAVTWVSLAERMAVEETLDAVGALVREQVPIESIVLNRVISGDRSRCRFCGPRRRLQQVSAAALISRLASVVGRPVPVGVIPDRPTEPTGIAALANLGSARLGSARLGLGLALTHSAWSDPAGPTRRGQVLQKLSVQDLTPLVWFGGKGGVGKTTCAAATALTLATAWPSRRILLLSADPAHSLGDVLRTRVSNEPRTIPGGPRNLAVRELDVGQALQRAREEYASAIDALFDRAGASGFDAAHDRRVMHGLMDLAPPGLDELVAILEVTSLMVGEGSRTFDQIVIDTAPTGHALRLLEMPAVIQDWTHALMRIVLKYQPVVCAGNLGQLLLTLSKQIGALRHLLVDRSLTQFVLVTRAAALPRAETVRFLAALSRLGITVPAVVVNAVGRGKCGACRRAAVAERREVRLLARAPLSRGPRPRLILAPAVVPPPEGVHALTRWRRRWLDRAG